LDLLEQLWGPEVQDTFGLAKGIGTSLDSKSQMVEESHSPELVVL